MDDFYDTALDVAKNYDVTTKPDSLVLYSVSYLPTRENKEKAFAFIKANPQHVMIDHTLCGIKMIDMGLDDGRSGLKQEEVMYLWKVASKRMLEAASGNVTAFVKDADERSVFRSMELPTILANDKIKTINGEDKFAFAKNNFNLVINK